MNGLLKAVTFLLIFSFVVSFFAGCSSADPAPASAPEPERMVETASDAPEPESEPMSFDEPAEEEWDFDEEVSIPVESPVVAEAPVSEGNMGPIPILLASETGRQLVYNTDIIIETTEFMEGQRRLLDKATELNGHSERTTVNGRSLTTPYVERNAYFRLRLPPENLIEFIIFIEDNYQLYFLDKRMRDFTITHERNVVHLEDLKEREERLLAELEEEQTTRSQRDLERDLDNIQADIRNLEAQSAQLDWDVDFSDITISLFEIIFPEEVEEEEEEPVEPPTFGERLQDVTVDSLENILAMVQGLLLFLIRALPWLIPLAILAFVILRILKRVNIKTAEQKKDKLDSFVNPTPIVSESSSNETDSEPKDKDF